MWLHVAAMIPGILKVFPSVVTVAMDIHTDYGCRRAVDPDITLGSSPGQDFTMAPGSKQATHISPCLTTFASSDIWLSPQDMSHSASLSLLLPYPTIYLLITMALGSPVTSSHCLDLYF